MTSLPLQVELATLLASCGHGDAGSFIRLHELAAPRLLSFIRRFDISRELAEDILQESLVSIWRNASYYNVDRSNPMSWMCTIARNKQRDVYRAQQIRFGANETPFEEMELSCERLDPCAILESVQAAKALSHCLAGLGPNQRQAIHLAFYEDLAHPTIATELRKPLGTVKTLIRRGLHRIRAELAWSGC